MRLFYPKHPKNDFERTLVFEGKKKKLFKTEKQIQEMRARQNLEIKKLIGKKEAEENHIRERDIIYNSKLKSLEKTEYCQT